MDHRCPARGGHPDAPARRVFAPGGAYPGCPPAGLRLITLSRLRPGYRLVLLIAAALLVLYYSSSCWLSPEEQDYRASGALIACQNELGRRMSPVTFALADWEPGMVEHRGGDRYQVNSYVGEVKGDEVMRRIQYTCTAVRVNETTGASPRSRRARDPLSLPADPPDPAVPLPGTPPGLVYRSRFAGEHRWTPSIRREEAALARVAVCLGMLYVDQALGVLPPTTDPPGPGVALFGADGVWRNMGGAACRSSRRAR